jgi:urease accessory protein UreE
VDVRWDECRQVLRKRTRGGEEVRVLLPRGQKLRHGDVLGESDGRIVAIHVLPCDLVVVRADEPRRLAELALALGNLHWPTQVAEREILFVEEPAAMDEVMKLGLSCTIERRRFEPLPVRVNVNVRLSESLRLLRPGQDQIEDVRRRKVANSV